MAKACLVMVRGIGCGSEGFWVWSNSMTEENWKIGATGCSERAKQSLVLPIMEWLLESMLLALVFSKLSQAQPGTKAVVSDRSKNYEWHSSNFDSDRTLTAEGI